MAHEGLQEVVPLSEAAIAPGTIKAEGSRRTIAHLDGGIVREILVRDGDAVRAGQPLLRLDDIQAATGREALRAQRWALLAQDSRIAAEIAGATAVAFPPELLQSTEQRAQEAMDGQKFETLGSNSMEERTLASPAMFGRAIYMRTEGHLYRIEQKDRSQ